MKLRELRIKNNMTQNDIAIKLGVSGQTILNWENGIYEPKINQLIELADIFGVSVDYLIEHNKKANIINVVCNELEKIPHEDFIKFIKECLEEIKK